jgi:hypothetical protein
MQYKLHGGKAIDVDIEKLLSGLVFERRRNKNIMKVLDWNMSEFLVDDIGSRILMRRHLVEADGERVLQGAAAGTSA